MSGEVLLSVVGVLLVLVAAGLVVLEAALQRMTPVVARALEEDGDVRSQRLARLLADRARPLNLLLLLRTGAEMGAAVAVALVVVHGEGDGFAAFGIALGVMTVLSFTVIGVVGRTLGQQHARGIALATAGLIGAVTRLFGPLPRLLIALGNAVTPGRGFREGPFFSETELRAIVEMAEQRGLVDSREREMFDSVFSLGDTLAREVMVPRPDIVFVERGKTVRQALTLALRSGFSRVPVIGAGEDDIVGVAHVKDLARRATSGSRAVARVEDVMRPAVFVPDSKPADELLRDMQADRVHLVILVDEYGGTAGLVTIEDVLEEIVGEITDESDREAEPVVDLGGDRWRVTARLPVDELEELLGGGRAHPLERDGVETVYGLLADELGRVPIPGAEVTVGAVRLTAESALGRRNKIGTVLVVVEGADEAAAGDGPVDRATAEVGG